MYKKIPQYFSVIVLALVISFSIYTVSAQFRSPTVAPPGGNVDAPITTGTTAQTKGNATFDGDTSGIPVLFGNNSAIGARNTSNTAQTFLVGRSSNNDTSLLMGSGGDFFIKDYLGNTKMTVEADGTVGINATNPDAVLQVDGGNDCRLNTNSGYIITNDGSSTNLCLDNNEIHARNNGSHATLHLNADGGAVRVHSNVGGEARFTIESSGNVGIGVNSPNSALEVNKNWTNPTNPLVFIRGVNNEAAAKAFEIQDENNNTYFEVNSFGQGDNEKGWVYIAGNLGINDTNPTERLDVGGNIKASGTICDGNGCIGGAVATAGGWTDSGSVVRLSSSGDNVGIGTSNPSEKLEIYGGVARMEFEQTASPARRWMIGTDNSPSGLYLAYDRTADTSRIFVDTSGNVGISDTSPSYKLEVAGGSLGQNAPMFGLTLSNGDVPIVFQQTSESSAWTIGLADGHGSNQQEAFVISRGTSLQSSPRFVVKTNGNIGIGVTNPSQRLEVAGSIKVANDADIYGLDRLIGFNDLRFFTNNSASNEKMRLWASGGLSVGNLSTDPGGNNIRATDVFATDDVLASGDVIANANIEAKGLISGTGDITAARNITAGGLVTASAFNWGNNSGMSNNQGGAIELGQNNSSNQTPFIDLHYGDNLPGRDFSARIIADGSGQLTLFAVGAVRLLGGPTTIHLTGTQASQRLCHTGGNGSSVDVVLRDCGSSQADLAELYGTEDGTIEAGDVVSFLDGAGDGVKFYVQKSSTPYQENVMGVISTDPYDVMGEVFDEDEQKMPVALTGRVPVKVTTENGAIKAGDRLTASSLAGHAMRATEAGMAIGMAMEDFDGDTGMVMLFVDIGYWAPPGK